MNNVAIKGLKGNVHLPDVYVSKNKDKDDIKDQSSLERDNHF